MRWPKLRIRLAPIASTAATHRLTSAETRTVCRFRSRGEPGYGEPRRNLFHVATAYADERHLPTGAPGRNRRRAHDSCRARGWRLPGRSELVAALHGLHPGDRPLHRWALPRSVAERWRCVVVWQPDHPGDHRGGRADRPVLPVRSLRVLARG